MHGPLNAADHALAHAALRHWAVEPVTIVVLTASAAVYAAGTQAVWRRAGRGRGVSGWQAAAFAGGLLSIAVALLSPVAWLSGILFSVHMTQHEILMLVAAPLLVIGRPLLPVLWAVPVRTREAWGRWTGRPAFARAWRALTAPAVVFSLHAAAIWIWHVPRLYERALADEAVHALEHVSFLVTAALFWWGMVHGRYGRIGYGVAVAYVFLTGIHTSVLGALLTVAPGVWYPAYTAAGAAWHLDALEDQQLAGLLMWIPSGVVFIVVGLALFAAWLGESERRADLGSASALLLVNRERRPLRIQELQDPIAARHFRGSVED